MAHFYLIRHGQKERQLGDPALTAFGHEQAAATGRYLQQFPITHIVASPRLRTQQTASGIAAHLHLPVATNDLLRERFDLLDGSLYTIDEFMKTWIKATHDRDYTPPGGDSSRLAGNRISQVLHGLSQTDHQHIAIITHGGVIADFVRSAFSDAVLADHTRTTPHGLDYRVDECSITTVELADGHFHLHQLVTTKHLELPTAP